MWGGGTSNLQGGAIYAYGAHAGGTFTITISDTEFKSNSAGNYVRVVFGFFEEKETS